MPEPRKHQSTETPASGSPSSAGPAGSPPPAPSSALPALPSALPALPSALPALPSALPALPFAPSPGESAKAFETFLCYFDIGQNRSFAKVAKLSGVHLTSVKVWANRYRWRDRVRAYNTELLRTRLAVETDARRNQADLRMQRALLFQDAEWKAAEKLLRAAQGALDVLLITTPEKLTLGDVARALEIASKLGRLATGLSTEHVEHAGEVNVNLQLEIESAIQKVYGPTLEVGQVSKPAGAGDFPVTSSPAPPATLQPPALDVGCSMLVVECSPPSPPTPVAADISPRQLESS